ncbi:hypothetical protein P153DRAFT_357993 [Dothidotthia symphoricarpi CBS 119687]|uniref:Uncharacterized protein n=1 Tax=Dothidotthia symphoricarpi CBS 119687 TaxID=1392245 RepID=A0A6A6AC16_9PLEO|nr:uncharacterized protein P153DRAFT_357993 [Dothidotthia symphoricarpi CBS 119687]KAF2128685.1 hypothetical protein P153DRAFT_357993 [Dothidotthia symphoricarpi CBS 119687]
MCIATDLAQLKAELGEQAHLLDYAPRSKIKTEVSNDPDGISFKILFGYLREKATNDTRNIWVHLIPASRYRGNVAVHFKSYDAHGHHYEEYETARIGRIVSGCHSAFKVSGRWSKPKLIALAKYYFLVKLVEIGLDEDLRKTQYGLSLSGSFCHDVIMACLDFRDEAERTNCPGRRATPPRCVVEHVDTTDTDSSNKLKFESDTDSTDTLLGEVTQNPSNRATSEREVNFALVSLGTDELVQMLADSHDDEERITEEIDTIGEKIIALQAEQDAKECERLQLAERRHFLLEAKTGDEIYSLGRKVERMHGSKRRRVE